MWGNPREKKQEPKHTEAVGHLSQTSSKRNNIMSVASYFIALHVLFSCCTLYHTHKSLPVKEKKNRTRTDLAYGITVGYVIIYLVINVSCLWFLFKTALKHFKCRVTAHTLTNTYIYKLPLAYACDFLTLYYVHIYSI